MRWNAVVCRGEAQRSWREFNPAEEEWGGWSWRMAESALGCINITWTLCSTMGPCSGALCSGVENKPAHHRNIMLGYLESVSTTHRHAACPLMPDPRMCALALTPFCGSWLSSLCMERLAWSVHQRFLQWPSHCRYFHNTSESFFNPAAF